MATAKEEVRQILDTLPDDATLEDVQYAIYVRERIQRAREEVDAGNTVDEEEVDRRLERWLEK